MEKMFLKFNKNDCMGFHACEVACKQQNTLGVGPRLIRIIEITGYNSSGKMLTGITLLYFLAQLSQIHQRIYPSLSSLVQI